MTLTAAIRHASARIVRRRRAVTDTSTPSKGAVVTSYPTVAEAIGACAVARADLVAEVLGMTLVQREAVRAYVRRVYAAPAVEGRTDWRDVVRDAVADVLSRYGRELARAPSESLLIP